MDKRRVQEHIIEDRSGYQLGEAFAIHEWILESFRKDYGEDFFVRSVENGTLTGSDFYLQLKGTPDIEQYKLSNSKNFSYPISLANLRQWHRFTYPVIVILWDIDNRVGYWLHIQPFIEDRLESNPDWLENLNNAKEPTRKIRIPTIAVVSQDSFDDLARLIASEHDKLKELRSKAKLSSNNAKLDDFSTKDLPSKISDQLKVTRFLEVAHSDPTNPHKWLNLAASYYQIDNLDSALTSINKVWRLKLRSNSAQEVRACILAEYAMRNDVPRSMLLEAISLFEEAQKTDSAMKHYNIGNCLSALGESTDAVDYYNTALKLEPSTQLAAQIWTNKGNAQSVLELFKEAEVSYKQAIQLDSKLWNACVSYGHLQARQNKFAAACKLFAKALIHNPSLVDEGNEVLYWYAIACCHQGRFNDALERVNQLLNVKPFHMDGLRAKEIILHELRQTTGFDLFDDATTFFQQRIVDDPQNYYALSELNQLYRQSGNTTEQRNLLEDTLEFDEPSDWVFYHYGAILESEGKYSMALTYFEQADEKRHNYAACCAAADVALRLKAYNKAATYYQKLLLAPTDPLFEPLYILEKLAECYYRQDKYVDCIYAITKAIVEFNGSSEWFWRNLDFALDTFGIKLQDFENQVLSKLPLGQPVSENFIHKEIDKLSA